MNLSAVLLVLWVARDSQSHPKKCFSKSLSSKIIPVEIRFSKKGVPRLHFVLVLSKFLMIISQDHSLLYWKLDVGWGG